MAGDHEPGQQAGAEGHVRRRIVADAEPGGRLEGRGVGEGREDHGRSADGEAGQSAPEPGDLVGFARGLVDGAHPDQGDDQNRHHHADDEGRDDPRDGGEEVRLMAGMSLQEARYEGAGQRQEDQRGQAGQTEDEYGAGPHGGVCHGFSHRCFSHQMAQATL